MSKDQKATPTVSVSTGTGRVSIKLTHVPLEILKKFSSGKPLHRPKPKQLTRRQRRLKTGFNLRSRTFT